jgi:hypothetical protein
LARWQIIKLKSTPAQLLAIVDAPTKRLRSRRRPNASICGRQIPRA